MLVMVVSFITIFVGQQLTYMKLIVLNVTHMPQQLPKVYIWESAQPAETLEKLASLTKTEFVCVLS